MILSPREIFFLGAALGWVICAVCFLLIPSWRARDIRTFSTHDLLNLIHETMTELRARNPLLADEALRGVAFKRRTDNIRRSEGDDVE
jgi:hypothetical protein